MHQSWLRKRRRFLLTVGGIVLVWVALFGVLLDRQMNPPRWEDEIVAFEQRDQTNTPPDEAVLFVGSSSIKLWDTLRNDFPRYRVFRRGFGGAEFADMARYAPRIIWPYDILMVVVQGGGNDLAAGKSPEEALADFKELVKTIREERPDIPIAFLSIKPAPERWHLVSSVRRANQLIREYIEQDDRLLFIDVFDKMLDGNGRPNARFYEADGLHLSQEGYRVWADAIRPFLPEEARKQVVELVEGPQPPRFATNMGAPAREATQAQK